MSSDPRETDSIAEFTDGDHRAAALLRGNLTRLRDLLGHPDSPVSDRSAAEALRHDIGDVLAGRQSMRDLAASPVFLAVAQEGMREARDAWQQLSADQRAAQLRAGRVADDSR